MTFPDPVSASSPPEFQVTLTLSVRDATALWLAAAKRGLLSQGATLDDVVDVIGPREDPSIEDCIAMLVAPGAVPGCTLRNFEVAERGRRFPRALIADNDERPARVASCN